MPEQTPDPAPRRRPGAGFYLAGLGLSVLHFGASYVAAFGAGVGGGAGWKVAMHVLTFPLQFLPSGPSSASDARPWDWLPWVALSLAWGFGLALLARRVNGSTGGRRGAPPPR